jgi:hypothetical protein
VTTVLSSAFFSRPSSWARLLSSQMAGSSVSRVSSFSRVCLLSKSKIPPQFHCPVIEIVELVYDRVELFRFHGRYSKKK